MKKIYFAGSIRGGREDAGLYARLIGFLSRSADVLTEHVGRADVFASEKDMTDRDIYQRDVSWIRECDLVIAECTRPSLGVGYELAFAESLGKPCAVLYRPSVSSLSAMLSGNGSFRIFPYEDEKEAEAILLRILEEP